MAKQLLSVDFDGVLVPNTIEDALPTLAKMVGADYSDGSRLWTVYNKLVTATPLPLNHVLLRQLAELKEHFHIHLWTNRSDSVKKATIANLNGYANIFDDFHFYSGHKLASRREGIVIDNNSEYLTCGEHGIHYTNA
jgi:hypothetical protein